MSCLSLDSNSSQERLFRFTYREKREEERWWSDDDVIHWKTQLRRKGLSFWAPIKLFLDCVFVPNEEKLLILFPVFTNCLLLPADFWVLFWRTWPCYSLMLRGSGRWLLLLMSKYGCIKWIQCNSLLQPAQASSAIKFSIWKKISKFLSSFTANNWKLYHIFHLNGAYYVTKNC